MSLPKSLFRELWGNHKGGEGFLTGAGLDHQCSINMSAALQLSGVDLSTFKGSFFTYKYDGRNLKLARSVDQLSRWLVRNITNLISPTYLRGSSHVTNSNWSKERLFNNYPHYLPDGSVRDQTFEVYPPDQDAWKNQFANRQGIIIFWDSWINSGVNGLIMRRQINGSFRDVMTPTNLSPISGHVDLMNKDEIMKRATPHGDDNLLYTAHTIDFFDIF